MSANAEHAARPLVRVCLASLCVVALVGRIAVAIGLEERNRRRGIEHEFADSELYWKLALSIASAETYSDGKRLVLRTPGYPLFLAGSIRLLGPTLIGARHMQAAVGALSCALLFFLVRALLGARPAWIAALLAAVYPFAVFLSVVLLSEALFTALLLGQLLTLTRLLAALREGEAPGRVLAWGLAVGLSAAAATLVRPSWILAAPLAAALVVFLPGRECDAAGRRRARGWVAATAILLAFLAGMSPWWARNWRVTGHFVPTTLWVGASLYDGLNEQANGASRMDFLEHPGSFGLDPALVTMTEWEQDRTLRGEAWRFARAHPRRVLTLAALKFARFWNPVPNAAEWTTGWVRLVSAATCGPVLVLALVGAWRLRRRGTVLLLLAGPVLYFSAIHLVFVSSVRYREAAMLPVLGLVGAALSRSVGHEEPR